jgi:hypothetical protein
MPSSKQNVSSLTRAHLNAFLHCGQLGSRDAWPIVARSCAANACSWFVTSLLARLYLRRPRRATTRTRTCRCCRPSPMKRKALDLLCSLVLLPCVLVQAAGICLDKVASPKRTIPNLSVAWILFLSLPDWMNVPGCHRCSGLASA